MIYRRALQVMKAHPRAMLYSLISVSAAVIIAYILGLAGESGGIIGTAIALVVIDIGRTAALQEMAEKIDARGIMRRICVDLGFLALLALIIIVIPLTQAFAVSIRNYGAATVIGILWYFLLAVFVLFLVEFFRTGYLMAVEGKTIEEAVLESARAFRRKKWEEIQHTLLYWAPTVIWIAMNAAVAVTGSTTLAILGIFLLGAAIIPFMEATYVVVNGEG